MINGNHYFLMFPMRFLNRRNIIKDSESGLWQVFTILIPALVTVCLLVVCFFPHLVISRFDNIPCPTPRCCSTILSFFHLDNLALIIATILIGGTTMFWFRRLWNAIKHASLFNLISDEKLHPSQADKLNRAITAIERLTNHKLPAVKIFNSPLSQCFTKGWLRPKIWISNAIVSEMDEDDLQVILSHELCHVLRYDNLVSYVLTFITELSWTHSGCRTLLKRWFEQRELFCDNFSAQVVASRQKVALTLVKFAEVMTQRKGFHMIIPSTAFHYNCEDKPFIQTRVENLLCNRNFSENLINTYRYKLWLFAFLGLFMFIFVVAASIMLANSLTYVHCFIEDVFSFYCSAC